MKQLYDAFLDPIHEVPIYAAVELRLVIGLAFAVLRRRNPDALLVEDILE